MQLLLLSKLLFSTLATYRYMHVVMYPYDKETTVTIEWAVPFSDVTDPYDFYNLLILFLWQKKKKKKELNRQ